jgi:hypothetical protein
MGDEQDGLPHERQITTANRLHRHSSDSRFSIKETLAQGLGAGDLNLRGW